MLNTSVFGSGDKAQLVLCLFELEQKIIMIDFKSSKKLNLFLKWVFNYTLSVMKLAIVLVGTWHIQTYIK